MTSRQSSQIALAGLRVFFYTHVCIFLLLAGNARVNCVQYGFFTRMKRACNAAIPMARTVVNLGFLKIRLKLITNSPHVIDVRFF